MSCKVQKYLAILFLKLLRLRLPGKQSSWQILSKFSSAVHDSRWHSSLCFSSYKSHFTCLKCWVWAAVGPFSAVQAWGEGSAMLPLSLSASPAVSAAVSAGVRVRSCRHRGRVANASGSAQQPTLGTDKQWLWCGCLSIWPMQKASKLVFATWHRKCWATLP